MELSLEKILWILVFIDSISTNIIVWFFPEWYEKKFNKMSSNIVAKKILISLVKKSRDLNFTLITKLLIILNSIIPGIIDILIFKMRKKDIISNLKIIQDN